MRPKGLFSLWSQVRALWLFIWWPLEAYMVVNFRAHGINRDVRKLTRISTLNYKKKEQEEEGTWETSWDSEGRFSFKKVVAVAIAIARRYPRSLGWCGFVWLYRLSGRGRVRESQESQQTCLYAHQIKLAD